MLSNTMEVGVMGVSAAQHQPRQSLETTATLAVQVLYLAGVSFLNGSRGTHLEAPPPEAFGWISVSAVKLLQ